MNSFDALTRFNIQAVPSFLQRKSKTLDSFLNNQPNQNLAR
ncbi:hypothetical protein N8Z97_00955 [Gammaproteobacteria bacterium]|nr:hypothetical protein [Gammaproteobacteria bacterium]